MKVFLSWSKDLSRDIAQLFAEWLPGVIQECQDPFISVDIDKGEPWFQTITGNLETTDLGIVFITPENHDAVWLNFEAGAMLNKFGRSGVCPVLVGMKKSDYDGPLKNLQLTELTDRDDVGKLLVAINKKCANPLASGVLDRMLGKFWADLHDGVSAKISDHASAGHTTDAKRDMDDKVDELLSLVRGLSAERSYAETRGMKDRPLKETWVSWEQETIPREERFNIPDSFARLTVHLIHQMQQESTRQARLRRFRHEYGIIFDAEQALLLPQEAPVRILDAYCLDENGTYVVVKEAHSKPELVPVQRLTPVV